MGGNLEGRKKRGREEGREGREEGMEGGREKEWSAMNSNISLIACNERERGCVCTMGKL